jgi:hypothetical protein
MTNDECPNDEMNVRLVQVLFRHSSLIRGFGFRHSDFQSDNLSIAVPIKVSIMFGYAMEGKKIFTLGDRPYELIEVDGPICRGNQKFPAQFDHDAQVLRLSKTVPMEMRPVIVAVAISDAYRRMWKPIPVIWPHWRPDD